jgi:hypothetical protein
VEPITPNQETPPVSVTVDSVIALARHGLYPVRLHYPIFHGDRVTCSCGSHKCNGGNSIGKHPVGDAWGKAATDDTEVLQSQWENEKWNVGLILGICHGIPADKAIIDIEDDTPEGRELAAVLLDGVDCPMYTSGKSIHRLFRWSDNLPPKANMTIDGLEFRFGGQGRETQSMAPPSVHFSGRNYEWLPGKSLDDVPLIKLPEHVVEWLREKWTEQAAGKAKGTSSTDARKFRSPMGKIGVGGRHHSLLIQANNLWRQAFKAEGINGIEEQSVIDLVWMQLMGANLLVCDPPKTEAEVQVIFESSQSFMRKEFEAELEEKLAMSQPREAESPDDKSFGAWLHRHGIRMRLDNCGTEQNPNRIDEWVCDWKMKIITKGDEPTVSVEVPAIEQTVVMTHVEFDRASLFARKMQQETNGKFILDRTFPMWDWEAIWHGKPNDKKKQNGITRGIREFLVNQGEVQEKSDSLSEQIEDLIVSLAGPRSILIREYEAWVAASSHKFTSRLKFAPGTESLSTLRLPEDPLTGYYPTNEGVLLLVKLDEITRRFRGAYGGIVSSRQITDALNELGFEKKRLGGHVEGRWFVRPEKEDK